MGKKTLVILSMSILTFFCVSQAFSQNESTLFPGIVRIESGLSIGAVEDYFAFPGARGAVNTVLAATDGSGTTAWQLIQDKNLQGIGEAAGTSGQVLGSNGAGGFVWISQGTEGILRLASSYIVVNVTTTSTAAENGTALLAAYAYAVNNLTSPNDETRSATNRAVVLLPPGRYDLGENNLVMDEEYVDLVGLSTVRSNQHIIGETNGNEGVITQDADNVRIENLTVELSGSSGDAAYYPTEDFEETIVRNCEFIADDADSMKVGEEYPGVFENCKAGDNSFGGGSGGKASGSFIQCIGGNGAFGGAGGSAANGTFRDCIGGERSFGGDTDGVAASGAIFFNCEGGADSFGDGGVCAACAIGTDVWWGKQRMME